jgi:hypothetical protein
MPEMANPGESHRHAALIGRGNYIRIPDRSSRLNGGGCPSVRGGDQPIRERKERIAAYDALLQ